MNDMCSENVSVFIIRTEMSRYVPCGGLPWWLIWYKVCLQCRLSGFSLWVGKIPCRRERLPTPVFWPRQRSLMGYSLWDLKEYNTAE